jgi:Zn-dependent protease with chaperone function
LNKTTLYLIVIILLVLPLSISAQYNFLSKSSIEVVDSLASDELFSQSELNTVNDIYPLSDERKEKLHTYSQFVVLWRFISFMIGIAILYLILRLGFSSKIRDWSKLVKNEFISMWMYLIIFFSLFYLLNLPFKIYREILVEQEFGFFSQTVSSWIFSEFKFLLLTFILGIIPFYVFYKLIDKVKNWWIWYTLGSIPVIITVVIISPIFIMPLFNDYEPLKDQDLNVKIQEFAEQSGVEEAEILQMNASEKSTRVNAFVDGLLNTRRIVLYDNLIENFDFDEIKFVVSHEIGHYKKSHIWKGLLISFLIIGITLWLFKQIYPLIFNRYKNQFKLKSLSDYASLPLLLIYISLFMFMVSPLVNYISRYHEHQADKYALEISNVNKDSAVKTFEKLSAYNLADPDPHPFIEFWFYSHPSLKKRIDFVNNYNHVQDRNDN